jgi:hypothetical protein
MSKAGAHILLLPISSYSESRIFYYAMHSNFPTVKYVFIHLTIVKAGKGAAISLSHKQTNIGLLHNCTIVYTAEVESQMELYHIISK